MGWLLQRSHLGKGEGCSSKIIIISPQFFRLKWFRVPFQFREYPGHTVKGQGHCVVPFGELVSYTWGRCSIWLTDIRFQSIAGFFLFILIQCSGMDTYVSSTQYSSNIIYLHSCSRYDAPKPVHHQPTASSNIPNHSAPVCHVIVWDFATFATRPYLQNRPMRTLSAFWGHSESLALTIPFSEFDFSVQCCLETFIIT